MVKYSNFKKEPIGIGEFMTSDLNERLLNFFKVQFGADSFLGDSNYLVKFTKSLEENSLAFALYEANEFRQKGNMNKAILIVSELVRDHITSLRYIQRIFDKIHGNDERKVVFEKFKQWEPLEVGISNAPDTLRIVDEFIAPWKEENRNMIKMYLDLEKKVSFEKNKKEVFERISGSDKNPQELNEQNEIVSELEEKQKDLRYELAVRIIGLAEKSLKEMAPGFNNSDRLKYLMKLVLHLGTVILSAIDTKPSKNVYIENEVTH